MHYLYLGADHTDWLSVSASGEIRIERSEISDSSVEVGALRDFVRRHTSPTGDVPVQVGASGPGIVVPLAEFEESAAESIYRFTCHGDGRSSERIRVFYDLLPASNGVLIFAIEESICQTVEDTLGEVHYFSVFTALLHWMAGRKQTARQSRVFVHCRGRRIDVAFFEGHRIFAFNTFDVQTDDDAVYFACKLAEQFNFNPRETPFVLCGVPMHAASLAARLRRYVARVEIVVPTEEFGSDVAADLKDVPFELLTKIIH